MRKYIVVAFAYCFCQKLGNDEVDQKQPLGVLNALDINGKNICWIPSTLSCYHSYWAFAFLTILTSCGKGEYYILILAAWLSG